MKRSTALLIAATGILAACVASPPKEPHVVCNTEHGLTFTSRYDRDDLKCVTDKRDEGSILETGLSRGGKERFWLRVFARNKKNPSEQIKDVTPESLIKDIEDDYATDGNTHYPYRLKDEEKTTVQISGRDATRRQRNLVVNGFNRTINYLLFDNEEFEFMAVLTPHWYDVTKGHTTSMTREVIQGLSVQ